jgi:membrane protein implicated in regulation of membrane protease activity
MTDATRRFLANLLMAVGGLIALLCGGCTVFFLGAAIVALFPGGASDNASTPLVPGITAILVGGLPTVLGVALFLWGRRMKRRVDARSRRNLGDAAP